MSEFIEFVEYIFVFWRLLLSSDFRQKYLVSFKEKNWFGRLLEVLAVLISATVGIGVPAILTWWVIG